MRRGVAGLIQALDSGPCRSDEISPGRHRVPASRGGVTAAEFQLK
jgi:hypothetical protein